MTYRVIYAEEAARDLSLIFDFLVESYTDIGEGEDSAFDRARRRIAQIRKNADSLAKAPFRGTIDETLAPGLRHVTIARAIDYFDVDEKNAEVRILAIFFGGQDHRRRMLERLL